MVTKKHPRAFAKAYSSAVSAVKERRRRRRRRSVSTQQQQLFFPLGRCLFVLSFERDLKEEERKKRKKTHPKSAGSLLLVRPGGGVVRGISRFRRSESHCAR